MKKTLITTLIITLIISLITICSADIETILVNGEINPTLSPGDPINFSWNPEYSSPQFLKVWIEGTSNHYDMHNNPANPLFIENGYPDSGNYTVEVHCSQAPGNDPVGNFTIEVSEPEPPEPEPYNGPVFVTHITTLTVTAPPPK